MRQLSRRRPNHRAEGAGHNLAEQQVAGRQKQQISTDVYGHGGGQTIAQKGQDITLQSSRWQAGRSNRTAQMRHDDDDHDDDRT